MRNQKILTMVECAVMIALAFALSFVQIWKMPLGGSVTLASMLPIMFIAIKHGTGTGLSCAFLYSLTQFAQGLMEGTISATSMSIDVFIIASLFDYVVPFTLLGLSGVFRGLGNKGIYMGMTGAVLLRFICHYLTGVTIWSQWTPAGWSSLVYSAAYNGGFLLPDFAICVAVAILLLQVKDIRRLIGLK